MVNVDFDTLKEIDERKIKKALEYQVPIEVTTYTLPKSMEMYIQSVLRDFLTTCHQNHMHQYLSFCLSELLTNAKKANTKRVYFKEKCLDINDDSQYAEGMTTFKVDTLSNINHYLELQKQAGLYIKFLLQIRNDSSVRIEIRNNARLTKTERKRIQEKLEGVKQYQSIEEVMNTVMDQSEGAGLGIIIMILMLEKIGLSRENYQVIGTNTETITRIFLPCDSSIHDGLNEIYKEFAKKISAFPVLKENYESLQNILNNGCNKNELLKIFQKDAVLTFLLLSYVLKEKGSGIKLSEVLEKVSETELKLLFTPNSPRIELVDNQEYKKLLQGSEQVAFSSLNLYKNFIKDKEHSNFDAEDYYVLGLLSNLGRLMIAGLSAEQKQDLDKSISEFEEKLNVKNIYNSESNYTMLSCYLLDKVSFPSDKIESLKKSSFWDFSSEITTFEPSTLIAIANIMFYYDIGDVEYYQVNKFLLKSIGIECESQLKDFIAKMKSAIN